MKCNYIDKPGKRIFACANRSSGFISFYGSIIGKLKRVYILKGGPGTGKSSFLASVALAAEKAGLKCVYIHCSSDPSSLDGIVIPSRSLGIFDGTPPHVLEPRYPGAVDEIINLGEFWDSEKLIKNVGIIKSLSDKKQLCYSRAIYCMAEGNKYAVENLRLLAPYFDSAKAEKAALSLLNKKTGNCDKRKAPSEYTASSPGMKGLYRTPVPSNYTVTEVYGSTAARFLFMMSLRDALERSYIQYDISFSPYVENVPEEITLRSEKKIITVLTSDKYNQRDKSITANRFLCTIPGSCEKALKAADKRFLLWLRCSDDAFTKMKGFHFALEDIYSSSMNFEIKEKKQEEFISSLFIEKTAASG